MSDKSTFPLPKSFTKLPQFNKIQQNQQDILQKISDFQDDLNNITQYIESQNNKQNNVITDAEILRIFLDEIQFGKYYDKLIDNGVEDIKTLALLNAEELKEIGIKKIGYRKKLLHEAQNYNSCSYNHSYTHSYNNTNNTNDDSEELKRQSCINDLVCFINKINNPKPQSTSIKCNEYKIKKLRQLTKENKEYVIQTADKDEQYLSQFENYIFTNKENNPDPFIHINENQKFHQSSLLKKAKCKRSTYLRCPKLKNQFELIAKKTIPANVVIGEYYGREMMAEDLNFLHTKQQIRINEYGFTGEIYLQLSKSEINAFYTEQDMDKKRESEVIEPPLKKRKIDSNSNNNNNDNKDNETKIDHIFRIVIDGINVKKPPLLVWMNDCKADINLMFPTDDDLKFMNVKFVNAYLQAWPKVFAVTCKEIKQGEALWADYGPAFREIQREKTHYYKQKKFVNDGVNRILNQYEIDVDLDTF
eukprot:478161_1